MIKCGIIVEQEMEFFHLGDNILLPGIVLNKFMLEGVSTHTLMLSILRFYFYQKLIKRGKRKPSERSELNCT